MLLRAVLTATVLLLVACGADPSLTEQGDQLKVVEVAEPPPTLPARWEDQTRDRFYAAVTWRSVAVWEYATALRFATAYHEARRTPVRLARQPSPSPITPTYSEPAEDAVGDGSVWDSLAQCESGGQWDLSTGNGFYGGLQFTLQSWHAVGGQGYPHQNSREEQIARAERLLAIQGWGAWPACSSKLGLR